VRNAFRAYILPTPEEFTALWENAIVCFDASVLLNVYGYSDDTREELLSLLERQAHRVRLPHQFGLEFVRNRAKVIRKQVGNYRKVEEQLEKIKNEDFSRRSDHPFPSPAMLSSFDAILAELAEGRKKLEDLITEDPYLDRILKVFDGKVGPKPTNEELNKLHSEAKVRYQTETPPGYKDLKKKGEPEAFKDYVGWSQLIDSAKKEQKDVILVCDDLKEDWWNVEKSGRVIGPRYELIQECLDKSQRFFYMYTLESFLRYANIYLKEEIKEEAITEVSQRLAANTEIQLASTLKATGEAGISDLAQLKAEAVEEETKRSDLKPTSEMSETKSMKAENDDKPDRNQC